MARGKRRVAYRRRHQNRFSLFLVSLVVLMHHGSRCGAKRGITTEDRRI